MWWASSAPLANGAIGRPKHVELLVNTLGPPGARTILWDEFYHGHTRSFWSYISDTPFFAAITQALGIVALALFTYARRRRPIRGRVVEPRTSPLEFVDTMGGLYERARASTSAVATVHAHVRRRLLAALGLPPATDDERLVAAAAERLAFDRAELSSTLSHARAATTDPDLTARQAVPLVAQLQGLAARLERVGKGQEETMSTLEQVTGQARRELAKVIVGQAEMIDLLLLTVVCGGHALIEGVPGLAKTLAVRALARIMRLQFQRVQCTPDLMPADIVGANVFNMATSAFTLHQGPVFTDLLLVDEINRMPPRTQAALLEAMEERQVTIDGTSHRLSPAFTAFATQNPGRVRRHLSASRSRARSFPGEDSPRLSGPRRPARRRRSSSVTIAASMPAPSTNWHSSRSTSSSSPARGAKCRR